MLGLGPQEMIVVAILGVLLFGKRLPEVGRSLGKGIVEFKKGLRGFEEEFDPSATTPSYRSEAPKPDTSLTTVPKFEPPTMAPTLQAEGQEATVPHS